MFLLDRRSSRDCFHEDKRFGAGTDQSLPAWISEVFSRYAFARSRCRPDLKDTRGMYYPPRPVKRPRGFSFYSVGFHLILNGGNIGKVFITLFLSEKCGLRVFMSICKLRLLNKSSAVSVR